VYKRFRFVLLAALAVGLLSGAPTSTGAEAASTSAVPQPSAYNKLSGVSCVSAVDCWAVGSTQDMNNNVAGELLHWNGASWIAVSSPSAGGALESVSCTSSSTCWAVGNVGNGQNSPLPLIVRSNGASWTSVPAPRLPGEFLSAISCSSSMSCFAVGTYERSGKTLALQWNGSRWIRTPTANPSPKLGQQLTTVSCTSPKNCWALGYYYAAPLKPTVTGYLIALHWNGSTWKLKWTSPPYLGAESSASLRVAISCTSSNDCWAAGFTSLSPLDYHSILLHGTGRTWTSIQPPKLKNSSLYGVGCATRRECLAVGNLGTFYGGTHTLGLRWDGSRWTRVTTPHTKGSLSDVSCSSSTNCWAVGSIDSNNGTLNLALHWNGRSWS
jgi:hypothetical protein